MSRKFLTPLVLPADPTAAMEAATKQYADGLVMIAAADPIAATPQAEIWVDTSTSVGSTPIPASYPRGYIGQGFQTGAPPVSAAEADVTGCTVTWTADPTRRYRTTVRVGLRHSGVAAEQYVFVTDASNTHIVYASTAGSVVAGGYLQHNIVIIETGLTGSITRKVRASVNTGTATAGASEYAGFLLIEDIGGV